MLLDTKTEKTAQWNKYQQFIFKLVFSHKYLRIRADNYLTLTSEEDSKYNSKNPQNRKKIHFAFLKHFFQNIKIFAFTFQNGKSEQGNIKEVSSAKKTQKRVPGMFSWVGVGTLGGGGSNETRAFVSRFGLFFSASIEALICSIMSWLFEGAFGFTGNFGAGAATGASEV